MNSFWLLCVTLSFAVLLIGSVAGILLANAAAWIICRFSSQGHFLRSPGFLFSIRVMPVAFGTQLTLGFALPSFLLLEPKRSVEAPEPYLILLACLALAAVAFLATRGAQLLCRSRKTLKKLLQEAQLLPMSLSTPVYGVQSPESIIAVAGILRPRVLVGKAAFASLTLEELRAAIAHELAHIHSLDNLKQLVLKTTRFPNFFAALARMDAAWSAASELVADANALRQGTSALELSAALVKVGRLKTVPIGALSVGACHLIPPDAGSSALAMRIQHLHDAMETHSKPPTRHTGYCWTLGLLAVGAYMLVLPSALPVVHRWMEWLVR